MLAASAIADIMGVMAKTPPTLLQDIEAFLSETGIGESYFGKKAAGNSELVARLREGRRVWPETESKVRSFLMVERGKVRKGGHDSGSKTLQRRAVQKDRVTA